jgi:hypothetical protein
MTKIILFCFIVFSTIGLADKQQEEYNEAYSRYEKILRNCYGDNKKYNTFFEQQDCILNKLPQRCKPLVFTENKPSAFTHCLGSCIGKNTAFGDCSN